RQAEVAAGGVATAPPTLAATPARAPTPSRPGAASQGAQVVVVKEPGRLYPAWWQRVLSLVGLVVIALTIGLAAGGAVAFGLVMLYRAIENTL
ncbi:MAG: hypothetical protein ACRD29_06325, partial [Acidimicrobiales bacterium]